MTANAKCKNNQVHHTSRDTNKDEPIKTKENSNYLWKVAFVTDFMQKKRKFR